MDLDPLFGWIEHSSSSLWINESPSIFAFHGIGVLPTLGMGLLVGVNAAIALRILGIARRVRMRAVVPRSSRVYRCAHGPAYWCADAC
jgi:hypothetical protein